MTATTVDLLKAMAHPARFAILETLAAGERNVSDIERLSGIAQPALSQQLAVLRDSGLVEARREAKLVYYRLCADALSGLRDSLAAVLGHADRPEGDARRAVPDGVAVFARLT